MIDVSSNGACTFNNLSFEENDVVGTFVKQSKCQFIQKRDVYYIFLRQQIG